VSVYIGPSSKSNGTGSARGTFALYWGDDSPRNAAYRFQGAQNEARGSLFGVLKTVCENPPYKSLIIHTTSQYTIRSFCYWAGDNATRGWPCIHANVLIRATTLICGRSAPVKFRWVSGKGLNVMMATAKKLA
ncbi:hypothetical protein B0H17DRAFT_863399, partial [Mycena rosella]